MSTHQDLGHLFLRTIWIFQAIAAGPIFVCLGALAFSNIFSIFDRLYEFITDICTALLAAGIIFAVAVQRKLNTKDRTLTLRFELAKSALATALWVWLMLDAAFGPHNHFDYYGRDRQRRITVGAISSILLLILFYPTVWYAAYVLKRDQEGRSIDEGDEGERRPLLGEQ